MVRRESMTELAEQIGVTQGLLTQWRERDEAIDASKGERVAELCDVPFDWLMRGERAAVPAPELFARFLPVYREWVKRGGLKKRPTKAAVKTSVEEIEAKHARRGKRAG